MNWPDPKQALEVGQAIVKATGLDPVAFGRDVWRVLWKGRVNLFLVGCGGTGKTSLGKFLETRDSAFVPAKHLATDVRTRGKPSELERWSVFYDYPGQWDDFKKEFTRQANISRLQSARRLVVLMCCAYGFHSDWGEKEEFTKSKASTDNLDAEIANRRDEEKSFLKKFLDLLASNGLTKLDMLTVILKQDLWYNSTKDVEIFYKDENPQKGNQLPGYSKILKDFQSKQLGSRFRHYFYPLSLRRQEFVANLLSDSETVYSQGEYTTTLELGYRKIFLQGLENLVRNTAD